MPRSEIRNGKWPNVFESLQTLAKSPSSTPTTQLTYALCIADAEKATNEILKVDLTGAPYALAAAMLLALKEPNVKVDLDTQLDWTAGFICQSSSGIYDCIHNEEFGGPFAKIDWQNIAQDDQSTIDNVAGRILSRLDTAMADLGKLESDIKNLAGGPQRTVATLSRKLSGYIAVVNLSEPQRQHAIDLLRQRIDQLVLIRDESDNEFIELFDELDKPANVAAAILLLGGQVPPSLKSTPTPVSPYFRSVLPTPSIVGDGPRGRSPRRSAEWFPYQTLEILSDASWESVSRASWNRKGINWMSDSQRGPLILDYLRESGTSSTNGHILVRCDEPELVTLIKRHPQWKDRIDASITSGKHREEIKLAIALSTLVEPDMDKMLANWLRGSDPIRTRIAIRQIVTFDRSRSAEFSDAIAPNVATAIERLANSGPLEMSDIQYMQAVADRIPQASQHALEYIRGKLEKGEISSSKSDDGLLAASYILVKHPDEIRKIESGLRSAVGKYSRSRDSRNPRNDKDSILRMLKKIDAAPTQP